MVYAPASVSLLIKLQTIKENLAQTFYCKYCEVFKNTFFEEHLQWLLLNFFTLSPVCFPLITQKWPQACNVIKKGTLAQVFSCEFGEIFKNTFFKEHLRLLLMESVFFISRLYQSTLGHMGQSIQEWTKSNLLETAFKKFEGVWSA